MVNLGGVVPPGRGAGLDRGGITIEVEIVSKRELSADIKEITLAHPLIAKKARAGQFVIVRVDETGERIPLTIAHADPAAGTVTVVVQEVGKTSALLGAQKAGQHIADLAGPLGHATEIERYGTVCCIGGGVGIACVYPIARALRDAGNQVISIIGARTRSLLTWEDRMREVSDELLVTTDDGSYGHHGFVTDELTRLSREGRRIDRIWAVGPAVMMRAVAKATQSTGIPTVVSLNSIMIDGTGMCGGCRVSVGGKTRFVCVDGPEFDAHQVDFDELMHRQAIYRPEEAVAMERFTHQCKAEGQRDG